MTLLQPDRYFSRLSHIDIQRDLLACGFRAVLLDIDNTLLRRDTHQVPRDVLLWLRQAQAAGVDFCLLSNNWHASVHDLARQLGLPLVAKACKPLPHGYLRARGKLGASRTTAVVIGDQLSTDILGAHVLGMKAYLLAPLVEQDLRHTVVIRRFERALMGGRQPEGAPSACEAQALDDAPARD